MALIPTKVMETLRKRLFDKKIEPPEGFESCPECKGKRWTIGDGLSDRCSLCDGKGYVDWIEFILGKKKKKDPITSVGVGGLTGGSSFMNSHNHHTHMHGLTGSGQIGSIVGGSGINVQHTNCHHVSSSQSAMCSTSISVSDPTISLDFDYIKEELKDWIEEHIKNEVSKRVQDELMRRGVK